VPGAIDALKVAVALDPSDGYALKNLGGMMVHEGSDLDGAATFLEQAVVILPDDPQVWLSLGRLGETQGDLDAADRAYLKVIKLSPPNEIAEEAKRSRSRIAEGNFREAADFRHDAVQYCLVALQTFDGLTKDQIQPIAFEIAMLGTKGLDVNSPERKYTLRTLPGDYAGLHLLCIQYVGFQLLDPSINIGFDLSREFAEAKRQFAR
jgi:tetratricopeptide (TPR) repeat protein